MKGSIVASMYYTYTARLVVTRDLSPTIRPSLLGNGYAMILILTVWAEKKRGHAHIGR